MKKILHIAHSVGGVDVSIKLITKNLNPNFFENSILHGKTDTKMPFIDKNKNLVVAYKLNIYREISPIKDFLGFLECLKLVKKLKPQIIHGHSAKGGVYARIIGFITKTPVAYTPQAFSYFSAKNILKRYVLKKIEIYTKFSSYLVPSSESELIRGLNEIEYKNILLFNNSIPKIKNIHNLSIKKTWPDNYICTVGRPSFQKNIELMVQVINKLNEKGNIHLVLMGVGPVSTNTKEVKRLIKKLNLESKVTLLNWTSQDDVFHIIKNSTLYLSTARYEGLPYSIIEAMALGKSCVVSNCDGNRDLIINGENGYVIKDDNIDEYVNKIYELLHDENKRKKFEENSLKKFEENYDIEKTIKNLENIYNHIIDDFKKNN